MMTGRRRNELNSLTDCLVFAGLVGAGFGWIEDIFYIASGENLAASVVTAAIRLVMGPFAHSLFTSFFGIGVYFALQQRSALAKVGWILLGYLGAVLVHALWNGSTLLGAGYYFGAYVLWLVPMFAAMITLAVFSRRHEQQVVAAKLPGMVQAGLITLPTHRGWGRCRPAARRLRWPSGSANRPMPPRERLPVRSSRWHSCGTASTAGSAMSAYKPPSTTRRSGCARPASTRSRPWRRWRWRNSGRVPCAETRATSKDPHRVVVEQPCKPWSTQVHAP